MKFLRSVLYLSVVCSAARAEDVSVIEEIIDKVNVDIITHSDIERTRRQIQAEQSQQQNIAVPAIEEVLKAREKDFLRERIDQLLLVQKAKELNLNVDQEVSKYLADIQREKGIADPEKFQQFVAEQTGMPYEDF